MVAFEIFRDVSQCRSAAPADFNAPPFRIFRKNIPIEPAWVPKLQLAQQVIGIRKASEHQAVAGRKVIERS